MLSNFSIGKRLVFGFGLLIVLLIAISVFGLSRMAGIMTNLEHIVHDSMPKTSLSATSLEQTLTISRAMHDLQAAQTAQERTAIRGDIEDMRKKNSLIFTQLEAKLADNAFLTDPAEVQLLDKLKDVRVRIGPMYEKIYSLMQTDVEQGRAVLARDYNPTNEEYLGVLREMSALQEKIANKRGQVGMSFYEETRNLTITIATITILFSVAFMIWLVRSITLPLNRIQGIMEQVSASNDFTQTARIETKDEIGRMATAFDILMRNLRGTFVYLKQSIEKVDDAGKGLVIASDEAARASSLTSEASSSMAASVEEMSVSINQVSDNAKQASSLANKAGVLSAEGGQVISNTVKEMQQIGDAIDHVAEVIGKLGDQSDKISSIVQVIKEVADQTNLLALNAAIEAARAGEAGRGFAVVADEVRKLAERTTKATSEISNMIGDIQDSSQSAVSAMQQTVEQVKSGRDMAEHAGKAIVEIRQAAADVVSVVEDIADSIAEQSAASQSIAQQLEQVAQAAEENSSSSAESSTAAHHLGDLAHEMRDAAAKFTV